MDALPKKSLREIFEEAAELASPAARNSFLNEACASDVNLRQRVEALLAADEAAGTIGESNETNQRSDPAPPFVIGRYRVIQKIGEGGCGTVYLAEQTDPIRRAVALKVIKLGMDTRQVIRRFESERQALALMDHPNIARVLDAGTSDSGKPYFVMDLVTGISITEYCDRQRLDTRQRLELFEQACHGVQHAHQKGVIHRDLKPSNILVTEVNGKAMPKIIDFGIAKAIEGRLSDRTVFTAMEQFLGTPAYMSPEQASGGATDVDTRSDIYSLGVLLYQLLTGGLPFDQRQLLKAGCDEMRRIIREIEPARPSARLSTLTASDLVSVAQARQSEPPRLLHQLRGDLDWIVMKCLEKDRERRYETAQGLAIDLNRHLRNEPVTARPASAVYKFQRWVRRNKAVALAAAVVLLSLVTGLVTVSWALSHERAVRSLDRRRAYVSEVLLADLALQQGDRARARELLRHHVPTTRGADLREWEWRFLAAQCEGDAHMSLPGHLGAISNVRFLNSNTLLTTGLQDFRVITWKVPDGRAIETLPLARFGGGVTGMSTLLPQTRKIYYRPSWNTEPGLIAVDLLTGKQTTLFTDKGPVAAFDLSPDSNLLAIAHGSEVDLIDLNPSTQRHSPLTAKAQIRDVRFSPTGRQLVTADDLGQVDFWNVPEQRQDGALPIRDPVRGRLTFSPDGRRLVTATGERATTFSIWSVEDRSLVTNWTATAEGKELVMEFSPDGKRFAVAGGDVSIRLWDTETWRNLRTLSGHLAPIGAMSFSPDSRSLVSGSRAGELFVWSLEDVPSTSDTGPLPPAEWYEVARDGSGFARVMQIPLTNSVYRVIGTELWSSSPLRRMGGVKTEDLLVGCPAVVLAGGRSLVLGCSDGSIRLRGIDNEERAVTRAHPGPVQWIDVAANGSTLASLGDHEIKRWHLPDLQPIGIPIETGSALALTLSDTASCLACLTGSGDMTIRQAPNFEQSSLWRAFAPLCTLRAGAFSPDGRQIAVAAAGDIGFIWDCTAQTRIVLPRVLADYTSFSYSPNGTRLAAGSEGESKIFESASGNTLISFKQKGLKLAFFADGERLLAVHAQGAAVLRAPPLESFNGVAWLKENPSQEAPEYVGPRPAGVHFAPSGQVRAK